jgi:two-component system sensor histidine kinase/response regulator
MVACNYSSEMIHYWNTAILMTIYVIFAVLVATLKDAYMKEVDHAADMERLNKELAASYNDLESFSYSVSHDLRAPLRIIGGLSEAVIEDYHDILDDKGRNLLRLIRGNANRMEQLILSILDLSKVGKQELKIAEIDMEKETRLIAGDLKAMFPERNLHVNINRLPVVYGDITLLHQVLENLLPLNSPGTGILP